MVNHQLFQNLFEITDVDPHGKKFDRVSRIIATCEAVDMHLTLDVNTEIFPMHAGQKFSLVLANSLSLKDQIVDASKKATWKPPVQGEKTLDEDYDYVMYGKVYKYDDKGQSQV